MRDKGREAGTIAESKPGPLRTWGVASASLEGAGRPAAPCPELCQLTYHRGKGLDPQFTVNAELANGWLRANSDVSLAALLSCQPFGGR